MIAIWKTIIVIAIICLFGCSNNLDKWITYHDEFNIGSISMPVIPSENLDTTVTPKFKLVSSLNMSSIDNKENSPSTFSYDLYFPTDINEFDLFQMKKDSITVEKLFINMIRRAQVKSKSEVVEKTYFNFPEPGVKIKLLNNETKSVAICRIIIFDNYIIATCAAGTKDIFSSNMEAKFFNTLKINNKNRNRQEVLNQNFHISRYGNTL